MRRNEVPPFRRGTLSSQADRHIVMGLTSWMQVLGKSSGKVPQAQRPERPGRGIECERGERRQRQSDDHPAALAETVGEAGEQRAAEEYFRAVLVSHKDFCRYVQLFVESSDHR